MKTNFTIDVKEMAASLANSDNNHQAEFLNTFFYALRVNCGSLYNFDMQLHAINILLNERSHESVKLLTFEDED